MAGILAARIGRAGQHFIVNVERGLEVAQVFGNLPCHMWAYTPVRLSRFA